jgi:repressor LexA
MDINKYIGEKIRHYRNQRNLSQDEVAEELGTSATNISRYESGERGTNNDILFGLSKILNVSINDFFPPIDNADFIDTASDVVSIPVLGFIKAGLPIEAQQDIIDYIKIPKKWTAGGKEFYGLKISGDSMSPNYNDGDIVIFEQTNDYVKCNREDCAVMVNCTECTFKQVQWNENGVTLIPYNTTDYEIKHFSRQEVIDLPITIIGIAVEKRTTIKRKNLDIQD